MRTLLVALMLTTASMAANAQNASGQDASGQNASGQSGQSSPNQDNLSGMGSGRGHRHGGSAQKTDTEKPKADEKAYKAALDRIPDGGKYDPWHNVRH
jgi:hypothetical protein